MSDTLGSLLKRKSLDRVFWDTWALYLLLYRRETRKISAEDKEREEAVGGDAVA